MNAQIFQYNGNPVTFQLGNGDLMANATEMAKPFGKRPGKWLELPATTQFINALRTIRKSDSLIKTIEGAKGGTWMHEDVALEFARWLSPEFAIWCNDRIKELLRHGITATQPTIEKIIDDPDNAIKLLTALKEERAARQRLAEQNEIHKQQLQMAAPKVQYYNEVLMSSSTYTANQVAKELGMSAITLNRKLRERGVQYLQNGQWLLYSRYQGKGYTKTHTHPYVRSDGSMGTAMQTVWTEAGRLFIHSLFKA